jgi:hypothetical protein
VINKLLIRTPDFFGIDSYYAAFVI